MACQSWIVLFIIGLILFLIGAIAYESRRRRSLPTWAMVLILLGALIIIISSFSYLYKNRHTLPGVVTGVPVVPLVERAPLAPVAYAEPSYTRSNLSDLARQATPRFNRQMCAQYVAPLGRYD